LFVELPFFFFSIVLFSTGCDELSEMLVSTMSLGQQQNVWCLVMQLSQAFITPWKKTETTEMHNNAKGDLLYHLGQIGIPLFQCKLAGPTHSLLL
jgi:hypothetical protein